MNSLRLPVFLLLASLSAASAASPKWAPVAPGDLAPGGPTIDPDAPAEAIFRRIHVDDSNFPSERKTTEYVRYRIFDPAKAVSLTRVGAMSVSMDGQEISGDIEINARLTLPDGSVHDFGKEALRERAVVRKAAEQSWMQRVFGSAGLEVREKFLAVSGIEPGSILDLQTSHRDVIPPGQWIYSAVLQQADAPERSLDFTYQLCGDSNWGARPFTLNMAPNHATTQVDVKHRIVHIAAQNVPVLYHEPFSVPQPNYALTFLTAYTPANSYVPSHHATIPTIHVDTKTDPWGGYATKMYLFELDRARPTSAVNHLAAQVTSGMTTDVAKARAIHEYVQTLYHRFATTPRPPVTDLSLFNTIESLDQLLNFQKYQSVRIGAEDFLWLEIALDRVAGFEAHTVMLPKISFALFDPRLVADSFLPQVAARIKVGDEWMYSIPSYPTPLAFNTLPWEAEGQQGLVATAGKQVFFDVPLESADASQIRNTGSFELAADGSLSGDASRIYTGQQATIQRNLIRRMNPKRRARFFRDRLAGEFKGADLEVDSVKGGDDPNLPVEVHYSVDWPDVAVATKSRLIFHPSVFHAGQASPFTATVRHYPFQFPYRWKESDRLTIALPSGYAVEAKQAPSSMPGDVLDYRCSITQEAVSKKIHYSRDFTSNVIAAPATANGPIHRWYDAMAQRDQFELVLLKSEAPQANAAPDAP